MTEEVTGRDLVADQLRIAAGQPLGFAQGDVAIAGHAIELRLYAEDPARDFAPTTGPVLAFRPAPNVRTDAGIVEGGEVTAAFDPMLAKVVVHGTDRADAIVRADAALAQTVLLGCRTNNAFLRRLLADADFRAGRFHTGTIAEKPELLPDPLPTQAQRARILGAAALSLRTVQDAADAVPALQAEIGEWRN